MSEQPTAAPDPTQATPEHAAALNAIFARWEQGDLAFKDAAEQVESLSTDAAIRNHTFDRGRCDMIMGIMQGYRGNLDIAIDHFERARYYFESLNAQAAVLTCVLNLGESYRLKGDFARARSYFRTAFEGASALGRTHTQMVSAVNEGQLWLSMGDAERARESLERALALLPNLPEDVSAINREALVCESYMALAETWLHLEPRRRALDYARTAHQMAVALNQPLNVGQTCRVLGKVMSALEVGTDEAIDALFTESGDAFRSLKAEGEMARTIYEHALSLAARGKGMSAARKLQQAMLIFTRLGMSDDANKAARAQVEAIRRIGGARPDDARAD